MGSKLGTAAVFSALIGVVWLLATVRVRGSVWWDDYVLLPDITLGLSLLLNIICPLCILIGALGGIYGIWQFAAWIAGKVWK